MGSHEMYVKNTTRSCMHHKNTCTRSCAKSCVESIPNSHMKFVWKNTTKSCMNVRTCARKRCDKLCAKCHEPTCEKLFRKYHDKLHEATRIHTRDMHEKMLRGQYGIQVQELGPQGDCARLCDLTNSGCRYSSRQTS